MNNTDLNDVTILIPVRIDSPDRSNNLDLVIEFIRANFKTKIYVLEADKQKQYFNRSVDKMIFAEDFDPIFHHTKYRNFLINEADSDNIILWDADMLISPDQILDAVKRIRKNGLSFLIPYDGRVFKVDPILKEVYTKSKNLDVFYQNHEKMNLMYGYFSVGGIFAVNRNEFMKLGQENESFYGWGPEDADRVKRWEIMGRDVIKVPGPAYHLHHPRLRNSWYASDQIRIKNLKEFLSTCRSTPCEINSIFIHHE